MKGNCKRYVVEFAGEFLKNPMLSDDYKVEIRRILEHCKRGQISSVEAVECILKSLSSKRR